MVSLSRLAAQLNLKLIGEGDPEITGITEDSREAQPGWLFAAVPGLKFDGRDFAAEAVERGAAAVLLPGGDLNLPAPRLLVSADDLRPVMAAAANIIYGRPSERLILVGLTGTNGKTTTAYLMEEILSRAGLRPGVMGTVNFRWPGECRPAPNTTPEGPALSRCLAAMVDCGSKAAVLEVSSHALALGRVTGLGFEAALFTNLSRDHIDFHQNMEDYYQAKKLLFTKHLRPGAKKAVINIDDAQGRRLADELGSAALSFGFTPEAEVRGSDLTLGREGLGLTISYGELSWRQSSPLIAEVNGYNLLGAAALALTMKIDPAVIQAALAEAKGAPGRLERVGANPDYLVLVDYAHSPDALDKALQACRDLKPRRVLAVFGCGGDRDKGKRPLMGQIAGKGADLVILTSDNPRTEEPLSILKDVEEGLKNTALQKRRVGEMSSDDRAGAYLMMADRREAIAEAVRLMAPGDILLIAGKGHEDYQIIGREKIHLDDREEALAALTAAGKA